MTQFATRLSSAMLAVALTLAGCSQTTVDAGGGGPEVVAAFYPLAEAARRVGGSEAIVHDLTPAGVEPHDLELKPSDFGRLRSADLILYLGGGFQPALEDAIKALPDPSVGVDLLQGLPLLKGTDADEPTDPHVWLDPTLMVRVVQRIATEMIAKRPSQRGHFGANARRYVGSLVNLHASFDETLGTCRRREIVTAHAAFGYLASRYNLAQIAIAELPEVEPSPRRLEEVARIARRHGATTIFAETLVSARVADAVAHAVGARTAVLNPIEGLTDEQISAGEDYVSLMRKNLAALAEGLDCKLS